MPNSEKEDKIINKTKGQVEAEISEAVIKFEKGIHGPWSAGNEDIYY